MCGRSGRRPTALRRCARELVGFLRTLLRTLRAGDAETARSRGASAAASPAASWSNATHANPSTRPGGGEPEQGAQLVLCLRDASGALQDPDATRRILVHELAHVGVDATGHGAAFRRADARLLAAARRDAAWRDPSPYASFCGVRVAP